MLKRYNNYLDISDEENLAEDWNRVVDDLW